MTIYKCDTCSKEFTNKTSYTRHLNRKYPCKPQTALIIPMKSDIDDEKKLFKCDFCEFSTSFQSDIVDHYKNHIYIGDISGANIASKVNSDKSGSELICKYCDKNFTRKSSLKRHLQGRCKQYVLYEHEQYSKIQKDNFKTNYEANFIEKMKKDGYTEDEIISILKKNPLLNTHDTCINNNNNNNNNTNITNNTNTTNNTNNGNTVNSHNNIVNVKEIKLVAFGKEDMESMSDDTIKKIIKKGFMSVPSLIEQVHFNKNKPENHNVCIPNIKEPYARIFDGDRWALRDKKEVIDELYNDKKYHLESKFEQLINKLCPVTKKKFRRFLEKSDDSAIEEVTKKDIKLLLYNSRELTNKSKKQYKKSLVDDDKLIE